MPGCRTASFSIPPMRTPLTLGDAVWTVLGVAVALTFAVVSSLVVVLLGLVLSPH
jgi:hypothetical protein